MSINQIRSKHNPFLAKGSYFSSQEDVSFFLAEMNRNCCRLGLRSSFFDSPHGLMNHLNMSTAFDIAKLSAICMEDHRFVKIVSTSRYLIPKSQSGNARTYIWENTHKLVGSSGVTGIKTGITDSAGPCLCTSITVENTRMIIVLLGSKTMDARWCETLKLSKWAIKRLKRIEKFAEEMKVDKVPLPDVMESNTRLL